MLDESDARNWRPLIRRMFRLLLLLLLLLKLDVISIFIYRYILLSTLPPSSPSPSSSRLRNVWSRRWDGFYFSVVVVAVVCLLVFYGANWNGREIGYKNSNWRHSFPRRDARAMTSSLTCLETSVKHDRKNERFSCCYLSSFSFLSSSSSSSTSCCYSQSSLEFASLPGIISIFLWFFDISRRSLVSFPCRWRRRRRPAEKTHALNWTFRHRWIL